MLTERVDMRQTLHKHGVIAVLRGDMDMRNFREGKWKIRERNCA